MNLLIKNAKIVKNKNNLLNVDICIKNNIINAIGINNYYDNLKFDRVIDAKGGLVFPGLIDIHTHLRQPGYTHKETIKTGSLAAARGGFTTICAMPNVNPILDTKDKVEEVYNIIKKDAKIEVFTYASITKNLFTKDITDFKNIKLSGAVGFTNDGIGVQDAKTMYLAMKLAVENNVKIIAHAEDESLLFNGVINEGDFSKKYSIPGILNISESSQVARDIVLAKQTGAMYHVCHVSTKETVDIIRKAKREGIKVTAEVTPHHLILTENDIKFDDANYKMNPPLRKEEDRQELIRGLLDGTIDCIATDHAPHTKEEKSLGILDAPFGIVGLETAFSILYTNFVKKGIFTLEQLQKFLTKNPSKVLNLNRGEIYIGARADIAVFDIDNNYKIDISDFKSKSTNTPFNGLNVQGKTMLTISNGDIVWEMN